MHAERLGLPEKCLQPEERLVQRFPAALYLFRLRSFASATSVQDLRRPERISLDELVDVLNTPSEWLSSDQSSSRLLSGFHRINLHLLQGFLEDLTSILGTLNPSSSSHTSNLIMCHTWSFHAWSFDAQSRASLPPMASLKRLKRCSAPS